MRIYYVPSLIVAPITIDITIDISTDSTTRKASRSKHTDTHAHIHIVYLTLPYTDEQHPCLLHCLHSNLPATAS